MSETISAQSESQICRLCLSETTTCFSLIEDFEVATMLESLTTLRISSNDEISTVMCPQCDSDLRHAFSIQQNFLKAEKRFRERNAPGDAIEVTVLEVIYPEKNEDINSETESGTVPEESPQDEIIKLEIGDEPAAAEEFTCDICGAVRTSKAYLKLHKYRCHKRVKCTVCDKIMSAVKIKNHMEVHKNKGEFEDGSSKPEIFKCETCGKEKFSKEALTRHISGIHTMTRCPVCDKEMSRASLPRHVETHTSKLPTSQKYICDICGKIKPTRDSLYRHKTDVHTKGKCPVCDKEFTKGSLKNHVELHQRSVEVEDQSSEENKYKCDICGTVKLTKASYYKHKYDHVQGECPICGAVMGQTSLQKHIKRHNKTYIICDLCGKSVDSLGLKSHIEHSHRDNAYKCQFCEAVYRQKQTLMEHEKKEHLGEADFICETCGKKFYKRISLRRHIESTHLKLKPYKCKVCTMGFYTTSQRTKHMRAHTDEKPFGCSICDASFRKKNTLIKHLRSQHDVQEELTVECNACGKKFASKAGLDVHSRVH